MTKYSNLSSDISVTVADTGILVRQGFLKQALFVSREHIPSFISDPLQTPVRVITPFAATALACYAEMAPVDWINVKPNTSAPDEFCLTLRSARGFIVAFLSEAASPIPVRQLSEQRVDIVITPMCVARIDTTGPIPSLDLIASVPVVERADFPNRFAANPQLLVRAVEQALGNAD
jgi:hypothetical protein